MESIFGIPVKWYPYLKVWMGSNNGVCVRLRVPTEYNYNFEISIEWIDSVIECHANTMQGVLSQARKELVKTGHRIFGGKS